MPSDDDLLFGKIALKRGFCSQGEIDWCVSLQSAMKEKLPLGRILLNQGHLTEAEHADILAVQEARLRTLDPLQRKRKEATLFGKLAVREGLLTEPEVNECLMVQAKEGEKRSLGEIMVERGYLSSAQVKELLARQQKKIMSCIPCRLSFTVLSISEDGKEILCPRCRRPLVVGKGGESTKTDAEFATQLLQAVKSERPSGIESRIIPPGAKAVALSCVVCNHSFEGAIDSTGRARCPACRSTFVPR